MGVQETASIVEQKQAEAELRHLRNLLENIINSMPSVLIGVDDKERVIQWNREAEKTTGVP
ncbi:MAG: PAS domain-containing protein, partial [Proteobacteria bacterium]|nr:PAS domain-containing protein [Pseudomonadota bacterium]